MSFKVAASDFDGTLFINQQISAENLSAIRNWRALGNKFGIVTGRAYIMLTPHLEEYNLEIDFAICENGAIIHDGDGKIISNLKIVGEKYVGLFGCNAGNIENLNLSKVEIKACNFIGGLVGYNDGAIEKCSASSNVSGNNFTLSGINRNLPRRVDNAVMFNRLTVRTDRRRCFLRVNDFH